MRLWCRLWCAALVATFGCSFWCGLVTGCAAAVFCRLFCTALRLVVRQFGCAARCTALRCTALHCTLWYGAVRCGTIHTRLVCVCFNCFRCGFGCALRTLWRECRGPTRRRRLLVCAFGPGHRAARTTSHQQRPPAHDKCLNLTHWLPPTPSSLFIFFLLLASCPFLGSSWLPPARFVHQQASSSARRPAPTRVRCWPWALATAARTATWCP